MGYKDKDRQREYQKLWIAKRRASFFQDKECVVCGSKDKLELDHIDPQHKISHNIWSWTESKRNAEISKCQVLCEFHHLEKGKLNGDLSSNSILSPQQVLEIRALRGTMIQEEIASLYGVDRTTVCNIMTRKHWKYI